MRNLALNPDLRSKIKLHNVGVAARSYATEAGYNSTWKGHGSVHGLSSDVQEQLHIPDASLTMERIELLPAGEVLTSIIADYPGHSVVAKIDCEGSEYEILRCLYEKRLLEKISIIMLEWHIHGPGELQAMLHDSGFSTYAFPLGPATGMLYAIQQGGNASEGRMRTSLLPSDKASPGY
jgi:FkbM family methyltransferase